MEYAAFGSVSALFWQMDDPDRQAEIAPEGQMLHLFHISRIPPLKQPDFPADSVLAQAISASAASGSI